MLTLHNARRQRGLVLILALIVLAAMSLAAVGLMRSVGGSNRVAGNLAFQQSALQSAEVGAQVAMAWLEQQARATTAAGDPAHLLFTSMDPAQGAPVAYRALREDPGVNQSWQDYWTVMVAQKQVNVRPVDASGNTVSYAIHRLCSKEGDPALVGCEATPRPRANSDNNGKRAGPQIKGTPPVYYRITVLVQGPRNASSFIQTIVSL
jgi:Tfp pilus assembly protein PilX